MRKFGGFRAQETSATLSLTTQSALKGQTVTNVLGAILFAPFVISTSQDHY